MIVYMVQARDSGYVVVDRRNDAAVTPVMTRREAWLDVWERNGRQGATPLLAPGQATGE